MKLRFGPWVSLVVAGLVVVSCSDDETPAGVAAEDGGGVPETSSPDTSVVPGNDAEVDASDAQTDGADAADADGGIVYTGNHLWSMVLGEPDAIRMGDPSVATGPLGSIYLAGSYSGTIDFGGGATVTGPNTGGGTPNTPNCYIARLDINGAHVWSKNYTTTTRCGSIASDASGVYVSGSFTDDVDFGGGPLVPVGASDSFLVKFDPSGNHVWSRRHDAMQNTHIATTGTDLLLIARNSNNPDFGGGVLTGTGNRTFVAKFAGATGAHVWSKQSTGYFLPEAITSDANGSLIAAGALETSVDWGAGAETTAGLSDIFVVKLNAVGTLTWTRRAGTTTRQHAYAVATNATGDVFVTGAATGTLDFGNGTISVANPTSAPDGTTFVAKLTGNGGVGVWTKMLATNGPSVESVGNAIAIDGAGNVIVTGATQCGLDFGGGALPATDGSNNIFVAKLSGAGSHLWSKGWASTIGSGSGRVAAIDSDGNTLLIASLLKTTISMGGGALTSTGAYPDYVVAKLGR